MERRTTILADLGHNWVGSGKEISAKRGSDLLQQASKAGVNGAVIHLFDSNEVFRDVEVAKINKKFTMGSNIFDTLVDVARYHNLDVYVAPHYVNALDMVDIQKIKGFILPNGVLMHDKILDKLIITLGNSNKPVGIETGIFSLEEVEYSLERLNSVSVTLLHSSGVYPTPDEDLRLNIIGELISKFDPDFSNRYSFGYSSTAETKEMDFAALIYLLDMFIRKIDIGDGEGIESRWSVTWQHLERVVNFCNGIHAATHPSYEYLDVELTRNDVANRNRWKPDPDDYKTPCRCGNA